MLCHALINMFIAGIRTSAKYHADFHRRHPVKNFASVTPAASSGIIPVANPPCPQSRHPQRLAHQTQEWPS